MPIINTTYNTLPEQVAENVKNIETLAESINLQVSAILELQTNVATIQLALNNLSTEYNAFKLATNTALSNLVDDIDIVNSTLLDFETRVSALESSVSSLQTALGTVQGDITTIYGDIGDIESSVSSLQTSITGINTQIGVINTTIATMQGNISANANGINANTSAINSNRNQYLGTFTASTGGATINLSKPTSLSYTANDVLIISPISTSMITFVEAGGAYVTNVVDNSSSLAITIAPLDSTATPATITFFAILIKGGNL